ncbi:unnamed protein product [Parascedosporium putredinis]|uniref:FHA domain-containing protein n=1 Tax=Parascedosporium putredinis TaxID=1442378 RepID=A0A9P1H3W3_9PEZI|nr:unnamed protein product [Parascedosporium putredinis]CAI7995108.1 unnamed protein product [Parascedosporium putredinis]
MQAICLRNASLLTSKAFSPSNRPEQCWRAYRCLPRPAKRQAGAGSFGNNTYLKYPTPLPTSSTGILSSSPPGAARSSRPTALTRSLSSVSERAPLSAVPSIVLSGNGETLLMGRSSNSSNYQLSANRLISRVHVKARYIPASSPLEPNKIEILCNGWNGLKLHCQGRTYELWKGDSFTSETEGTEIMLDVQDARVMIQWPKRDTPSNLSDSSWDDSPRSRAVPNGLLQSSPLRRLTRIESPVSPTPATNLSSSKRLQMLLPNDKESDSSVEIYVDPSGDESEAAVQQSIEDVQDPNASHSTDMTQSFSSDLSEPDDDDDENDPDEENDPVVHSFGPFGANLSNRLASITASSPKVNKSPKRPRLPTLAEQRDSLPRSPGAVSQEERSATLSAEVEEYSNPVVSNHVVNQLAYSTVTKAQLQKLIETTICIGIIERQGKDAAGKPLESEYYYIPEHDTDDQRRAAVVDGLRKPSLRACRKQHKQYYWKRPKTP